MDSGTKVDPSRRAEKQVGTTWSAGSNGHVGTLQLELSGVRLDLELYRTSEGELLWRWLDGHSGRVATRSSLDGGKH